MLKCTPRTLGLMFIVLSFPPLLLAFLEWVPEYSTIITKLVTSFILLFIAILTLWLGISIIRYPPPQDINRLLEIKEGDKP